MQELIVGDYFLSDEILDWNPDVVCIPTNGFVKEDTSAVMGRGGCSTLC